MFTAKSLRRIIYVALSQITTTRHLFWSPEVEELLIMIAAHESKLGRYLKQIGGGPAKGIWQIEVETLQDNYKNFLDFKPAIAKQFEEITGCSGADIEQLTYNPLYCCLHARLKLYRSPGNIPSDVTLMADYAKQYYNSPSGAATVNDYLNAYYSVV